MEEIRDQECEREAVQATAGHEPGAPARAGPAGRRGWRPRFGMKGMLLLPVLAALGILLYEAIDRWTAVPWLGLASGGPLVITIVDGATGELIRGARVRLDMGPGMQPTEMEATAGEIRSFGGHEAVGYRSAVRDTRRLRPVVQGIDVAADGYEPSHASAAELARGNRPSADNMQADFVVRMRRVQRPSR